MADQLTDKQIVFAFGAGTTCRGHYTLVMRGEPYSIIKHSGHTEYLNRMSGHVRCGVEYYAVKNGTPMYRFAGMPEPDYIKLQGLYRLRSALLPALRAKLRALNGEGA